MSHPSSFSLMAPLLPPPPPPPAAPAHHKSDYADYYYFVLTVAVIATVLVLSNVMAFACCSPCLLIRSFRRRFLGARTIMVGDRSQELIPVCHYKQEQAYDTECAVCLTSFMDGEEVRQLPACKHSFHAPCIDMWLYSHSSCPICRASVPVLSPPQRCPRAAAAREDPMQPQQLMEEPIGMVRVIVAMM